MTPRVLACFEAQFPAMQRRWAELLRLEPPSTPLASPDIMVRLLPVTLRELMDFLACLPADFAPPAAGGPRLPACDCGRSPYRAYFVAAEQAITEGFIYAQAALPREERNAAEVGKVVFAIRHLAHEEIEAFCGACVFRQHAVNCWQNTRAPSDATCNIGEDTNSDRPVPPFGLAGRHALSA